MNSKNADHRFDCRDAWIRGTVFNLSKIKYCMDCDEIREAVLATNVQIWDITLIM